MKEKFLPEERDYPCGGYTYRYFRGKVDYPFGYGLSYTTFAYSNPRFEKTSADANESVAVSMDVKNTGRRAGSEVVQVYVVYPRGQGLPAKEIKAFASSRPDVASVDAAATQADVDAACRALLGKTWGIAFDAAHNGIVGKADCEAVIGLIASMGVFNQEGGGHYVVTEPGFKGHVVLSNADVWSGHSRIADIHGGTVWISQLLSWCCLEAVCHAGGELKVFASTYVGDHIGDNDPRDCIRFEAGAKGVAVGNVECHKRLTIKTESGTLVRVGVNGARKER